MTKEDLQKIIATLDLSEVQDSDNLRRAAFTNKDLLKRLQEKYPGVWSSCKELVYWSLHYKEPDFIDKQFCPCGNRTNFHMDFFRYREYCSAKCTRNFTKDKAEATNLKKYGCKHALQNKDILKKKNEAFKLKYGSSTPMEVEAFKNKAKATNLERYGHEDPGKAHREKIQKTFEEKYGVSAPSQIKTAQDKSKATNLERYGSETYLSSETAKRRIAETNLKKYGSENAARAHVMHKEDQNREFITERFVSKNRLDYEGLKNYFNIKDTAATNLLGKLGINYPFKEKRGLTQKEIFDFLHKHIDLKFNSRLEIYPKELDIYIPSKKIAIEYDGIMYHSFGFSKLSKFDNAEMECSERNKHLEKTELCEEHGIKLFHIFENEWINETKRKIWESMLLNSIGDSERIFARKTEVKEVFIKEKTKFLEENHIQGACSSSVNLGLYYEDELVSIMTFGKSRFDKNHEWELLRFCNKTGVSVVGGAGKLLKAFRKEYKPKSIISYANRRWSQGNLYRKLGFTQIGKTKPNYFYFNNEYELKNRMSFQKHKLSKILNHYDPSLSETENMYHNGYRKIYDCGNLVFELLS